MDSFLLVRWVAKSLLTPPTPLWVMLLFGWLLSKRKPVLGGLLFWGALLTHYALMTNLTADGISHFVESVPAVSPAQLKAGGYEAIVVLGGGIDTVGKEFGQASLLEDPLARLRYAAYLSRETGIPIIASGGSYEGFPAEADVMKVELARDFGLNMKWVEGDSRTTWENATLSTDILRKAGLHKIVVVTQAWHMKRAVWAFQQQPGVEVIGAPTEFSVSRWQSTGADRYLPSIYALYYNSLAIKEIFAYMGYVISGKD